MTVKSIPQSGLEIRALNFSYGKQEVLRSLDWQLAAGKIHGLVGWNGAGKTTLFRTLAGILDAPESSLRWQGKILAASGIALLETSPYFYPRITGREYLELFRLQNSMFDPEDWNTLFDLPLDALIETYSTGMKKKLGFLGALGTGRHLLLLDEPFNGVDLSSNETLKAVMTRLRDKGRTIVVSSHLLESLEGLCDTMSFLHNGRIVRHVEQGQFQLLRQDIERLSHPAAGQQLDRLIDSL